MKKFILIVVVAMFGIVSGNAQFKDNGFKVIGEISSGFSSLSADGESGFGMISPGVEISLGANVAPQFYVGAGLGYNALIGVSDFEGTDHEAKAFVHGRFYRLRLLPLCQCHGGDICRRKRACVIRRFGTGT